MNARLLSPLRVASLAALSVVAMSAATPAYAADGDVRIVNTETVQVYTSSTGHVETRRVYEQLSLFGNGTVDVKNPISTSHLRNLDGFGGFEVKNGEQVTRTTVVGEKKLRSVSSYGGQLPLTVAVRYKLDGKTVEPGDIVGKSGKLDVEYTVENVTGTSQEVTFDDGKGGTVTKTVDVPIPMVGSLSLVAPSSFTNVSSQQANIAGDGKGGTKLSFTMTLFPPLGSTTAVFGYTADIEDGVVPRSEISALPVNPMDSPTFKTAADSYKGGADTGAELTDGATQIDANLLKLRDGAGDLLAGLIKLRDGADQLNAGLAGEAAPGAAKLADGAKQLNAGLANDAVPGSNKLADGATKLDVGLGQLNSGAKRLAAGTGEALAGSRKLKAGLAALRSGSSDLSTGIGALADGSTALSEGFNSSTGADDFVSGSKKLADGLSLLSGGLGQLADAQRGIPSAVAGATQLRDGVDRLRAGVSNPACDPTDPTNATNPCGLLQGLQSLRAGLRASDPANPGAILGVQQIGGGLRALLSVDPAHPGLPVAKGGVDAIQSQIADALATSGSIAELAKALTGVKSFCNAIVDPVTKATCSGTVDAIIKQVDTADPNDGVDSLREKLAAADAGLGRVSGGLDAAVTGVTQLKAGATSLENGLTTAADGVDALIAGVGRIQGGLSNSACDPASPSNVANPCGLREGLNALIAGLTTAVTGLNAQLVPGGQFAVAGATTLADKIQIAGEGAAKLAGGLGVANAGGRRLAAGAGEAAAGSSELEAGLGQLRDGSGQLANGAGDAADGSAQVADGASRLAGGLEDAADGSGQLSAGAGKLAGGLKDAADGSGQLAGGLQQAAGGAPQLVDGAQKLSDQGTKKLVQAGELTAQNYGEMYATMTAGAKRAEAENMAFGAPTDAIGLTAYSYVIQGDDGEGGRNLVRGLGGLAILGAGGGVFALRRRLV